jgi:hypothetical protein
MSKSPKLNFIDDKDNPLLKSDSELSFGNDKLVVPKDFLHSPSLLKPSDIKSTYADKNDDAMVELLMNTHKKKPDITIDHKNSPHNIFNHNDNYEKDKYDDYNDKYDEKTKSPKSYTNSYRSPKIPQTPLTPRTPQTPQTPQTPRYDLPRKPRTYEERQTRKQELLFKFDRWRKKMDVPPFTMESKLEEMENYYSKVYNQMNIDNSIQFSRRMLIAFVTGIEFLNTKYDPLDVNLDGWSESVMTDINSYDDIFEELYEKYKTKAKMAPEIKLLFALGSSAFMFHLQKTMFSLGNNNTRPNSDILQHIARSASMNQPPNNMNMNMNMNGMNMNMNMNGMPTYNTGGGGGGVDGGGGPGMPPGGVGIPMNYGIHQPQMNQQMDGNDIINNMMNKLMESDNDGSLLSDSEINDNKNKNMNINKNDRFSDVSSDGVTAPTRSINISKTKKKRKNNKKRDTIINI